MTTIQFAADAAATPISKHRQAAKELSRKDGIKLSEALDRVARDAIGANWDRLMATAWSLSDQAEDPVFTGYDLLVQRDGEGRIEILIPKVGEDPDLPIHVLKQIETKGRDESLTRYLMNTSASLGRTLPLTKQERDGLGADLPGQSRFRKVIEIIRSYGDKLPVLIGPIRGRDELFPAVYRLEYHSDYVRPEGHEIRIEGVVPVTMEVLSMRIPLPDTVEAFMRTYRPDHSFEGTNFKVKEGKLVLIRGRADRKPAIIEMIRAAAQEVALLAWAGLATMSPREREKASWVSHRLAKTSAYDHPRDHKDAVTGGVVALNRPYKGNGPIAENGLLNLLADQTDWVEAAMYAGGYPQTRTLFFADRRDRVDLQRVALGAEAGARHFAHADLTADASVPKQTRKASAPRSRYDRTEIARQASAGRTIIGALPSEAELRATPIPDLFDPDRDVRLQELEDQRDMTGSYTALDCLEVIRAEPFSIDAYAMLSDIEALGTEIRTAIIDRGLFASRLLLGDRFMEEERGSFYSLLESRPHMRLLQRKMLIQSKKGDGKAAIQTCWEMIGLNKNDNLGARAVLMDQLLKERDLAGAKRLMSLFPQDTMPSITFGSVLVALSEGREDDARKALRKADMFQPHVVRGLLGDQLVSDEIRGGGVPMGGTSEAADYISDAGELWWTDPGAMSFLSAYAASRPEDWDRMSAIRSGEWRDDRLEDDPDPGY